MTCNQLANTIKTFLQILIHDYFFSLMRNVLLALFSSLIVCEKALGSTSQIVVEAEKTSTSVPESSFAILVGGVLWFLLLRKRA